MTAPVIATTVVVPVTTVTRGDTVHRTYTDGTVGLWKVRSVRHDGLDVVVDTDRGPMRFRRSAKVRVDRGGVS